MDLAFAIRHLRVAVVATDSEMAYAKAIDKLNRQLTSARTSKGVCFQVARQARRDAEGVSEEMYLEAVQVIVKEYSNKPKGANDTLDKLRKLLERK